MTNALPEAAWTADQAHAWLASLAPRGIQLGLDRVETALARLGSPHLELPAVTTSPLTDKGSTAGSIMPDAVISAPPLVMPTVQAALAAFSAVVLAGK